MKDFSELGGYDPWMVLSLDTMYDWKGAEYVGP
jgi:hypothetical protein